MGYTDTGINQCMMYTDLVEYFCVQLADAAGSRGEELPDCVERSELCIRLALAMSAAVWDGNEPHG